MPTRTRLLMASLLTIGAAASFNGCTCRAETGGGYYAPPPPPPQETVYESESEPPPPPPPVAEVPPPSPGPEFVWIGGYHRWNGHGYAWVGGRYERRPHAAARWEPAHWEVRGHTRVFVEGRWR